jgi:hypothetical protein
MYCSTVPWSVDSDQIHRESDRWYVVLLDMPVHPRPPRIAAQAGWSDHDRD